jgi:hypothetical protein
LTCSNEFYLPSRAKRKGERVGTLWILGLLPGVGWVLFYLLSKSWVLIYLVCGMCNVHDAIDYLLVTIVGPC